MNQFINAMGTGNSLTANGAATNSSSGSEIIDLFFLIGATRNMSEDDIKSVFAQAYRKDPTVASKILFYARDIEKGLGERRVFRVITSWLFGETTMLNNLLTPENLYNNIIRVDDMVYLVSKELKNKDNPNTTAINQIMMFLNKMLYDEKVGGIVAKWMPRKKSQYGNVVKYMRDNNLINSYTEYRKCIVSRTNVIEQQMSKKQWDDINLEHVPSVAMKKYKKAFNRHNILKQYVEKVAAGEAKINASKLYPYEIVKDIIVEKSYYHGSNKLDETTKQLLNEQWKNLSKLDMLPTEFRAIPVIDVSGSMENPNFIPMSMSVGLGIFIAEHNPNEQFRNSFITFSASPKFDRIIGHSIYEKVKNLLGAEWGMNTNIEATFSLILNKALVFSIPQNEMPTHIIIISDMEFDNCAIQDNTAMQMITKKYHEAGYEVPTIVFWNVNGRVGNVPARKNDKNVLLVSGASQNVVNFVLKKGYEDLMGLVNEVVNSERYSHIK